MIINGGSRSNGAFFSKHLMNGESNERVTLCELRNLAATNVRDALREMEAVAMGSLCRNYFYHVNINPKEHERLSEDQWIIAADTVGRHLRLDGHARFIVEHQKEGRTHRHIIWSRINVATMRATVMTDDYAKHQDAARELEKTLNLEAVPSVLGRARASGPRPSRRPKAWESCRGHRSGIDPRALKELLTRLYRESVHRTEFAARLLEHGMEIVKGHKADYCIVDQSGDLHSLARRLDGVTAAELRAFMVCLPEGL